MDAPKHVGSPIRGALSNLCPSCRRTRIFRHFVWMRPSCASCGYVYERENGYFLGAMVISYFLGAFSTVPTVVAGVVLWRAPLSEVIAAACFQVLLLAPVLFRYSRLVWIYLDYRVEPDAKR